MIARRQSEFITIIPQRIYKRVYLFAAEKKIVINFSIYSERLIIES